MDKLTAKEAKKIADKSTSLIDYVFEQIKELAMMNKVRFSLDITDYSIIAVSSLVEELVEQGYEVKRRKMRILTEEDKDPFNEEEPLFKEILNISWFVIG